MVQGSYTQDIAVLKEEQQLELQQAQEIKAKQQAAVEELEKGIAQLKFEQEDLLAKHTQDTEALLTSTEEAKNAAVQVCVSIRPVMLSKALPWTNSVSLANSITGACHCALTLRLGQIAGGSGSHGCQGQVNV